MSRKKIDKRISMLIKKCVSVRHRSLFFLLGENFRDQVVLLYHLLMKHRQSFKMKTSRPLWCFKKDLKFNVFQNKKLKKWRKNYAGNYSLRQEDVFEHFLLASNLQVSHYNETDKILGQTFGMLVIQDFNALTPNILARIIESVEGGGMIIFLLPNIKSLESVFSLNMDVHSKYITEANSDLNPLFNRRFVMSLLSCENCLVLNDSMKVTLIPEKFHVSAESEYELPSNVKTETHNCNEAEDFEKILSLCCTSDQSTALMQITQALKNRTALSVVSLTSARGRGKSAVLGLSIAAAVAMHLANIYVTSPHLENVQTLFNFVVKGLQQMGFQDNKDFKVFYESSNSVSFISSIQVTRERRQSVTYLRPLDHSKLGSADLVVLDEAAAIPLSVVKKWIGTFNVCMASTINGYEGTGRSLSLKLINQLRNQSTSGMATNNQQRNVTKTAHTLCEITLSEAIRYSNNDCVELWLNNLLCLDATTESLIGSELPQAGDCQLYYVNKRALFSYNKYAEKFLQQIISLFVTSHYKNTPNDLMMMADAPGHHIFCLTAPIQENAKELPTVLCVIQIALEGKISVENYNYEQSHGRRASGDLIPWIISQQFQEEKFVALSGARVVRIATHPDCQSMGYGRRALSLLCQFYDGSLTNIVTSNDIEKSQDSNLSLLGKLNELPSENLDYVGVSYGLTAELLKFWKKSGFIPLYVRQTTSDVTGEHSCVMIKGLKEFNQWLPEFYFDFSSRFVSLLPSAFRSFNGTLALSVLHCKNLRPIKSLSACELQWFISDRHLKRLDAYCNNLVDHHLILDLLPGISKLYFCGFLNGYFLSSVQEVILLCTGLQNKTVEICSSDLNMEVQQVMGCFRKALKKIVNCINEVYRRTKNSTTDNIYQRNGIENAVQKRKLPQMIFEKQIEIIDENCPSEEKKYKEKEQTFCIV